MAKRNPTSHLPRRAPKRTGKRGPVLDPVSDFNTPVKKEGEVVEKGTSLLLAEQPLPPKVVGERFQAFFRTTTFSVNEKTDKQYIHLHMTVELSKEHDGVLPKLVSKAHQRVVKERGLAGEKLRDIPDQNVRFYRDQTITDAYCELKSAEFTQARIDLIQKKGEGVARKIVRLTFVIKSEWEKDIAQFADSNY